MCVDIGDLSDEARSPPCDAGSPFMTRLVQRTLCDTIFAWSTSFFLGGNGALRELKCPNLLLENMRLGYWIFGKLIH